MPHWVKPGLPPWGPHVRFRRVQTLVREGSPLVKLRNSASKVQSVDQRMRWNAVSAFANCGRAVAHVRGSYGGSIPVASTAAKFERCVG